MEYKEHGGQCCGYGHIHGFYNATIEDFNEAFEEHLAAGRGTGRICEAILSHRQLVRGPNNQNNDILEEVWEAGGWSTILAQKGFRLNAIWDNSNTGRRCYQFLWLPSPESFLPLNDLPFVWAGERAEALVAAIPQMQRVRQERRVVLTEYYAETRTVGRRGPYETLEEAQQAWPRCRNFIAREIWSDGSVEIVPQ